MNSTAVRNIAIVLAIAALVFVSQSGFALFAVSINRIIWVLFVAGAAVMAYQYFKQNELAWYVIPERDRKLIIACGIGIVLLLTIGIPLLAPFIGVFGVIVLAAVLALAIVWMVRESRRFR